MSNNNTPSSAAVAVRWERRRGYGDGAGVLRWSNWERCSEADARRVTGLRSWEVRQVADFTVELGAPDAANAGEPAAEKPWSNERCQHHVCDEADSHDPRCTDWSPTGVAADTPDHVADASKMIPAADESTRAPDGDENTQRKFYEGNGLKVSVGGPNG